MAQGNAHNGIPEGKAPPKKDRRFRQWTDEERALLGQMSDPQVAKRLGISHNTVAAAREALGVPRAYVSVDKSRREPLQPEERDLALGTMSDAALAQQWGVPRHQVTYRQRRLGLPAYNEPRPGSNLIAIDGLKVKALRDAKRLTRHALAGQNKALANYLGLVETSVIHRVQPKTLQKLCELLGCRPEQIIRNDEL